MSDLADALFDASAAFEKYLGAHVYWPRPVVFQAARERLRLSKVPCESCDGRGRGTWYDVNSEGQPYNYEAACPACNGSGEVWPAELVELVALAGVRAVQEDEGMMPTEEVIRALHVAARAVLDAVESWMEAK